MTEFVRGFEQTRYVGSERMMRLFARLASGAVYTTGWIAYGISFDTPSRVWAKARAVPAGAVNIGTYQARASY